MSLAWIDDLGSFDLTGDTNGVRVIEGAAGLEFPPVTNTASQYLAADGAALEKTRYPPRTLDLAVQFFHETRVRSVIETLAGRLARGPGTLRFDDGTNVRDLLNVVYAGGLEGSELSIETHRAGILSLEAFDPWWYGQSQTVTLPFGSTTTFDDAGTDFSDAGTDFNGADSVGVTVAGHAPSLPVTTIEGPFDTLTVARGSSMFELASALADGDMIVIDSKPGNRGPRLNNGPINWSLLTNTSALFGLPVGPNIVSVGASGTGGNSNIEMSYRERHLTP